jgi:hypothetical protein
VARRPGPAGRACRKELPAMKLQVTTGRTAAWFILGAALLSASVAAAAKYDFEFTVDVYAREDTLWAPEYYDLVIQNTGTNVDTVDLVVTQNAPPGWIASLCIGGRCIGTTGLVALGPGETEDLAVLAYNRGVPEMGLASITGTMRAGGVTRTETFATFIAVPSIMLVDDDADQSYETYMKAALDSVGYDAYVWDAAGLGRPGAKRLTSFREVLWTTADGDAGYFTEADEADLVAFLDGGGNLFLASMGLLSSRLGTTSFLTDYLHLDSWADDVDGDTMTGITASRIADGMSLYLGEGPFGAGGTDGMSVSAVPPAAVDFTNAYGDTTGIRVEENGHKLVFLSFPFECISTSGAFPDNQKTLMARVIDWFDPPVAGVEGPGPAGGAGVTAWNSPNPFSGTTRIVFSAPPAGGDVRVEIYDIRGRLVRSLGIEGALGAEAYAVWDGKDASGRPVSPGVYFYGLGRGTSVFKKMVMVD